PAENFRVAFDEHRNAVACAALWDQRKFKQTVVRGYAPTLRRTRPLINFGAMLLNRAQLPAIGQSLSSAFVSHLACSANHPEFLEWFIELLHGPAHTRLIDYFLAGFDARDPRLGHLRKAFHARQYVSRIYAVYWEDGEALAKQLDNRLLAPEVALL